MSTLRYLAISVVICLLFHGAASADPPPPNYQCGKDTNDDMIWDYMLPCAETQEGQHCTIDSVDCVANFTDPVCPGSNWFPTPTLNTDRDVCDTNAMVFCEVDPYLNYYSAIDMCYAETECPSNGSFDIGRALCYVDAGDLCPPGYTYLADTTLCIKEFSCPGQLKVYNYQSSAYYKMDGDLLDSSGYQNHGYTSTLQWDNGKVGNALLFTDSYVQIPHSFSLNFGSRFSIEAWINVRASGGSRRLIASKGNTGGTNYSFELSVLSDGRPYIEIRNLWNVGAGVTAPTELSSGWHHIAATYDGVSDRRLLLYIDGVLVGSQNCDGGTLRENADTLRIGGSFSSSTPHYYNGWIDELRLYNKTLSQSDIATRYNNGIGLAGNSETGLVAGYRFDEGSGTTLSDHSSNSNHGTFVYPFNTSAPSFVTGRSGLAASFNGSNFITVPTQAANMNPSIFTLAAWINVSTSTSARAIITNTYWENCNEYSYRLLISENGTLESSVSTTSGTSTLYSPSQLSTGVWHHVASTFSGTVHKIYIDGALVAEANIGGTPKSLTYEIVRIGHLCSTRPAAFSGQIDELRVIPYALDESQISALYSGDVSTRCVEDASYDCPSGYSIIEGTSQCEATIFCDQGLYNTSVKKCLSEPSWRCPTNYSWNTTYQTCTTPEPECPNGMTRDEANRWCFWNDYSLFICEREPPDKNLEALYEYSWSPAVQQCIISDLCPGGTIEWISGSYRCKGQADITYGCQNGTMSDGVCVANPQCENGAFDSSSGYCIDQYNLVCPSSTTQMTTECTNCIQCLEVDTDYSCPGTSSINYTTGVCSETAYAYCPTGYSLTAGKCYASGSCPPQATFIDINGMCSAPFTDYCPQNFTYNSITKTCVMPPPCPTGITLKGDLDINNGCQSGYIWNELEGKCISVVNSAYNIETNICTTSYGITCPAGYRYNPDQVRCERSSPDCPPETSYHPSLDLCVAEGKCADGSAAQGGQCQSNPSCPDGYTTVNVSEGVRCEALPSCNSSAVYDTVLDQCTMDKLTKCPDQYGVQENTCQAFPLCLDPGNYSKITKECEATPDIQYFCPLDANTYTDLALCTQNCTRTENCVVGTINFSGQATATGGTTGYYRFVPSQTKIYVYTPSGASTSVDISPCRVSGNELSFTYSGNSLYTTLQPNTSGGVNLNGYTFAGTNVLLTWSMSWTVYGCTVTGSSSIYGANHTAIGFTASSGRLYPVGAYSGGALNTTGELRFTAVEACPFAELACVGGKCTLENACEPKVFCPEGYSTSGLKCLTIPTCPTTAVDGIFLSEKDVCEASAVLYCPTGFTEGSDGRCSSGAFCTELDAVLDYTDDKCYVCPTGFTYKEDTKACVELPACPQQTTYDTELNLCTAQPTCPYGGEKSGNKCIAPWTQFCDEAWTYNMSFGLCSQATVCPYPSSLDTLTDACSAMIYCPDQFTKNESSGNCETPPICPPGFDQGGTFFDVEQMKCTTLEMYRCSSTELTKDPIDPYSTGTCYGSPCPFGWNYNMDNYQCEKVTTISCNETDGEVFVDGSCVKYSEFSCPDGTTYNPSLQTCIASPSPQSYTCSILPSHSGNTNNSLQSTDIPWTVWLNDPTPFCYRPFGCYGTGVLTWTGVKFPSNLEKSAWVKLNYSGGVGASVSADSVTAPDGNNTADRITFSQQSAKVHQLLVPMTEAAGKGFRLSFWARDVSGSGSITVSLGNITWSGYCSYGSTCYGTSASVTTSSTSWQKYEVVYTFYPTQTVGYLAVHMNANTSASVVDIWDVQMTPISFSTTSNYCVSQSGAICSQGTPMTVYTAQDGFRTMCGEGGGDTACPEAEGYDKEAYKSLFSGLLGYWPLNNSWNEFYGAAPVSSGNYFITGKYYQAGSVIDTRFSVTPVSMSGDRTLASWINVTSGFTTEARGIFRANGSSSCPYDAIQIQAGGELGVIKVASNCTSTWYGSGFNIGSLPLGWHHIVAIISGTETRFYVNTVAVGKSMTAVTMSIDTFGRHGGALGGVSIDEVGIWNRVLSMGEIYGLYISDWSSKPFCISSTIFSCPQGTTGEYYGPPINKYQCADDPMCPGSGALDTSTDSCLAPGTDPKCQQGYILDTTVDPAECYQPVSSICGSGGIDVGSVISTTSSNIRSSESSGNATPVKAIDNMSSGSANLDTVWTPSSIPSWLSYDFGQKRVIRAYKLAVYTWSGNGTPLQNWTLEGSNDRLSWTVLDTRGQTTWVSKQYYTFTFINNTGYQYYRLNITGGSPTNTGLADIRFYEAYSSPDTVGTQLCGVEIPCPSGYSFNMSYFRCEMSPVCPGDGVFSPDELKCLKTPRYECPTGDGYAYTYVTNTGKCELDPPCEEGEYNPNRNQCYKGDTLCPLDSSYRCMKYEGVYQCSPNECVDMGAMNEVEVFDDLTSYVNDGTIDENGECSGTYYIFNGTTSYCRTSESWATLGTNCCDAQIASVDLTGSTIWEEQCKSSEIQAVVSREAGKCVYIGKYCKTKIEVLGFSIGCKDYRRVYCCFDNKLARIIHNGSSPSDDNDESSKTRSASGGRGQLSAFNETGDGDLDTIWGTPTYPDCRGFEPDEFSMIDFSKIDLSEYVEETVDSVQSTINIQDTQETINNDIQNYFNNIQK